MINLASEILAINSAYADKLLAAEAAVVTAGPYDKEEKDGSHLLQMVDKVGIVNVGGMLINTDSPWNRIFGLVSYNEVRDATIEALESGAEGLLYHFDSPGGRVSGMADLGNFISSLPVPTVSFTDSRMLSAAYFLGIQADSVYGDSFSETGSVGVVQMIADMSKMYSDMGIKFTRFRSGDLKQSGNPMFKLTDKEVKYLQGQVDTYAEKFFNIVSEARGIPRPMLDQLDITSGRTFIGEEAVAVGIVDSIMSFDAAVMETMRLAQKSIDKNRNLTSNSNNPFRI
jgi:signal peptide peptidase SppA